MYTGNTCPYCAQTRPNHNRWIPHAPSHPHARVQNDPYANPGVRWYSTPAATSKLLHGTVRKAHPYRTFYAFPRLPLELRNMIWSYAPPKRVLEIRTWGKPDLYALIRYSITPHRSPALLQVNQESRREALRNYRLVEIGVSNPAYKYVPWEHHPANSHRGQNSRGHMDEHAPSYENRKIYIDFSHDIIYLGPEFNITHLGEFLMASGNCQELPGLQYLALDRKIWLNFYRPQWDALRKPLFALRNRPLKELYIVPDDEKNALQDEYYYGKHIITLEKPTVEYAFWPLGQSEPAKTVVHNLSDWFARLWRDGDPEVPKVMWKSVRRNGRIMNKYKDGAWEIQQTMGDMNSWRTWEPQHARSLATPAQ